MIVRGGRAAVLAATAGGAAAMLLVWTAASGPVHLVDLPRLQGETLQPPIVPTPTPTVTATTSTAAPSPAATQPLVDLHWVGQLIGTAFVLLVVAALAALVRRLWRRSRRGAGARATARAVVVPDAVTADLVAEAIARRREQQLAALAQGEPRNAVVACWLELEDAVSASGVALVPTETAAELTQRVLEALDVDRGAVAELTALFHEARFSRHPIGEDERTRARAALQRVHADLDAQASLSHGAPA